MTRRAISARLATRIFWNTRGADTSAPISRGQGGRCASYIDCKREPHPPVARAECGSLTDSWAVVSMIDSSLRPRRSSDASVSSQGLRMKRPKESKTNLIDLAVEKSRRRLVEYDAKIRTVLDSNRRAL